MTDARLSLVLEPGEVGLFGYGSLLLQSSMEHTLARPYARPPMPCRVRGWRRTWDVLYPNDRFYYVDGEERRYPKNIIYLNAARAEVSLNGLIYVITDQDLVGFDRREAVYTRVDVREEIADVDVRGGPVWMYVGAPEFVIAGAVPRNEAAIRRSYIEIVEAGLRTFDAAFRRDYDASTDPPPAASIIDDRLD